MVLGWVLVLILALAGCTSGNVAPSQTGSEYRFVEAQPKGEVIAKDDRQDAPDVTGELMDGSSFELAELDGSIVVINFWASWCAPCRVEVPDLQQVYTTYQPQGVELIGVLVRDSKSNGEAYTQQVGMTYPSIFDPKGVVALQLRDFPIGSIPSTVVVDKSGKVAAAYIGAVDLQSLTKTIDTLLGEK
ncbi:redoxin domain-containing protein [Epidermidibacterium keratini]|uniref:Redoxin domain-containing protein n=1 Tax=Epidermidibacterium keratini TaxID=1891644 RepID=A0A7L4YKI6_9ACTN|nr:TlpA disulfide reductase family protein [Epidermidibacterium keratini]QHB99774.1 redoxin domain-containing protein [Epidermidibacterium keratini]